MKNIFFEKPYTKCGGETRPRSFSKKLKLDISLDQQIKVLYGLFLLHVQVKSSQNTLKIKCKSSAFTLCKAFLKDKKRSKASLPSSVSP